jgi:Protein of unknown function (DUF1566)
MKKLLITTLIVVFLAVATPASATFTDNGDGTVTDDVTGLMWIKTDESTSGLKNDACAYCDNLEFATYDDWRPPTIEELQTIIDYQYDSPAIDENVFGTTNIGDRYWSDTILTNTSDLFVWLTTTSSGLVENYYTYNVNANIRCVRGDGDMVKTTFVSNGDLLTVTSSDGLVWSKQTSGVPNNWQAMNWEDAKNYCSNLVIDDMSDWFLPTVEELRTLVAFDEIRPAADTSLFDVPPGSAYYWTVTEQTDHPGNAWQINFEYGYTGPADKNSPAYVRCAREAPPENVCDCPKCKECKECEECEECKECEECEECEICEKCEECPVCPACEPEIKFDGNCDLSGLTTYSELKAKRAELSKAIKELKKCHSAATRAMYKARRAERKALWDKKKDELAKKRKARKDKK